MTSARWHSIVTIFEAALERPQSDRSRFVQEACAGDAALESEVEKLLEGDLNAGSFLERPVLGSSTSREAAQPLPAILASGSVISDRFEILRFVGQGGMGQVYEALDLELKVRVALKAIRPEISSDPRVLSRFRREVQLTRLITHPNVCRTFDMDRHSPDLESACGAVTFLTMELLEGETLAALLSRKGRLTTGEAMPLVQQMVEALSAAHAVGVVHRDLKPSNVLLVASSKGLRVVITDFGLARALLPGGQLSAEQATSLTGGPGLMGTLVYMAPEQFERGETSAASDIYALGLVIYEMVTGQRPFADAIAFAEAAKRLKQPAPSPKTLAPELDTAWDAAIGRCLEVEPTDRFENVRQVGEALESDQRGQQASGVFTQTRSSPPRPKLPVVPAPAASWKRGVLVMALIAVVVSLSVALSRLYIRRHAPIQFAERDWILVTDFDNKTGEKVFDRVVRDLAVQSLSQSTYVNIVPRLSALEAAKRTGQKEVGSIDEKLGRELCLKEAYKALLTGDIFRSGAGYVIAMKVALPGKESKTFSDMERIQSPDELFGAVDRLTTRIRQALGEPLARIETSTKPLARVTTSSLEALQRYSAALDLYGAREFQRCVNLANDAVDMDPKFAMGHLLLARSYQQMGEESKSSGQLKLAREGIERVSERERHLILGVDYSAHLMNEKAADEYRHLLDIFPDDVEGLKGLSYDGFWAGYPDDAIAAQRRILELNLGDLESYDSLMMLLVRTSRFSEALAVFEQAKARKLNSTNLVFAAALASWGNGDLATARQQIDSLGDGSSVYWKLVNRLFVGKILAFQGRLTEATDVLKAGLRQVQGPGYEEWRPVFQYQITRASIMRGPDLEAKRQCEKFVRDVEKVAVPTNFQRGARLSAQTGDVVASKRFQRLAAKDAASHPSPLSQMLLNTLAGDIALASGHPERAVLLQEYSLSFLKWPAPYLALGEACERTHEWKCAIDAYRHYLDYKGEIIRDDAPEDWPLAHYSLAEVYRQSGDQASASVYYEKFLDLFAGADPSLRAVVEARRQVVLPSARN